MRRLQPNDLTYQQRRALTSAARALSIYDLGTKENLKQIFGDKWWEWGMPWGWPCVSFLLYCALKRRYSRTCALVSKQQC